jgi:hypothetical protein
MRDNPSAKRAKVQATCAERADDDGYHEEEHGYDDRDDFDRYEDEDFQGYNNFTVAAVPPQWSSAFLEAHGRLEKFFLARPPKPEVRVMKKVFLTCAALWPRAEVFDGIRDVFVRKYEETVFLSRLSRSSQCSSATGRFPSGLGRVSRPSISPPSRALDKVHSTQVFLAVTVAYALAAEG